MKKFSIIMIVYDQARELAENLPAFLQQEYEPGYEVIVVDESSTDDTSDVLKLLKNDHPHLYSTFIPRPNRLISRRKLAFHIGVKAAKNEWIMFTKIEKKPVANDILKAIVESMDEEAELMLGYNVKKGIRLQPFSTYSEARNHIQRIERKLTKVRERQRMNYAWGRYDFIIMRKDVAYDVLNLFEQKFSRRKMMGKRIGIFWNNLLRRSSTTKLVTE
ncbi:MAG: glycosyltransferase [Prevotella sp.]|nr:glycosyltransferase [Prevotella sp.]MBQ7426066.1 glycosyltransferase [Prevotella sp.]MBQ8990830.1 glycosyltransferase [Prevotella sp.]MBR0265645.1 glycosyltransferase [Prevotella sp.]